MNNTEHSFKATFKVRSYEVDHSGNATLPSVCNYFQEAAGLHAHRLNFDIEDLNRKGLTWILYRLHVKIIRNPRRWETVTVHTQPSVGDGIRAYRDYKLLDSEENEIALGVSQWMVLDVNRRRPVKLPDEIKKLGLQTDFHVLPETETLLPLSNKDYRQIAKVGRYNLDMNNHPNNVSYIEWLTGFIDSELIRDRSCHEIEVQYQAEAEFHKPVYVSYELTEMENSVLIRHSIRNETDGKDLALAVSKWK